MKHRRAKKRKPRKKARAAAATGIDRAAIAVVIVGAAIDFARCRACQAQSAQASLRAYIARVEPIRLGVNRLLDRADPIISAFHRKSVLAALAITMVTGALMFGLFATPALAALRHLDGTILSKNVSAKTFQISTQNGNQVRIKSTRILCFSALQEDLLAFTRACG